MLPSGINASVPSPGNPEPPKRGACTGWTRATAARNQRFLMSVDHRALDEGHGMAFTLTVRDCPASAKEWATARDTLLKRVARSGAVRWHWVTEWTKRGVPHLHLVVFWSPEALSRMPDDAPYPAEVVLSAWLEIAAQWGTAGRGQHARPLDGVKGWFAYCAKHAARGVFHYQRTEKPEAWVTTGRMWGKGGEWPVFETSVDVDMATFHVLRRLVRSYLVAEARKDLGRYASPEVERKIRRRVRYARRMLVWHDRDVSGIRGLGHWVDDTVQDELLSASWSIVAARSAKKSTSGR